MISLENLLDVINENTSIRLFNSNSYDYTLLGEYMYPNEIPDEYLGYDVMDIYAYSLDTICIDIDVESEE